MKKIITALLLLTTCCLQADEKLPTEGVSLREMSAGILAAQPSVPDTGVFDLEPIKTLNTALLLEAQKSGGYFTPGFRGARAQIEELRPLAKQLAESPIPEQRYYGARLNSCLTPTEESRDVLLKLAFDKDGSTAGTALDALFAQNLDTPALRKAMLKALEEERDLDRNKSTLYAMAVNNAGKWKLVESVPIFTKVLRQQAAEGGAVDRGIVRQLKELGPDAAEALPILERLRQQRKKDEGVDFRELEDLDYAIITIGGERKSSPPVAPNAASKALNPIHNGKSQQPAEPGPEEPDERSHMVLLSVAAVVLAFLALWRLRKKT